MIFTCTNKKFHDRHHTSKRTYWKLEHFSYWRSQSSCICQFFENLFIFQFSLLPFNFFLKHNSILSTFCSFAMFGSFANLGLQFLDKIWFFALNLNRLFFNINSYIFAFFPKESGWRFRWRYGLRRIWSFLIWRWYDLRRCCCSNLLANQHGRVSQGKAPNFFQNQYSAQWLLFYQTWVRKYLYEL